MGEQFYDVLGVPDPEASFWDNTFWRDTTAPLESPIVPGDGNSLYFRSKNFLGEPMATPATGMTIKTGAALGFTPPVVPPALARVFFSGNVLRFDGTPDAPADPLGRLQIANPHPLQLENFSSIDFDRTRVQAQNILVGDRSGFQLTGDVTSTGAAFNLYNPGITTIDRIGAGPVSPVLARQGAIGNLTNMVYSYSLHPVDPDTGNASVFRAETGGSLSMNTVVLNHPTGVVFDADATAGASSILLGGITTSGKLPGADPLTMFRAEGNGGLSPAPNILVASPSQFNDLTGTFASATNGGKISFQDLVALTNADNEFRVRSQSGSEVVFSSLSTTYLFTSGTTGIDWEADTGGLITGGMVSSGGYLHGNGAAHAITVAGGGQIDLMPGIGLDAGATFTLSASGAGSVAACPNSFDLQAWTDGIMAVPGPDWDHYNISITNGATLRGGSLFSLGELAYPDMRGLSISGNANLSTIQVQNSTIEYLNMYLSDDVQITIGGSPAGSTLRHFECTLGSNSSFTVTGGTWQPAGESTRYFRQVLAAGGSEGGSSILLTGATVAHEVDIGIGEGDFVELGPPPLFPVCNLTVNGGSTWTGSLTAGSRQTGRASVLISGPGTTAGLRHVNLGATAFPDLNSGPGPGGFEGNFFTYPAGDADMTVAGGARLSIGCYTDTFGDWRRPDDFQPAWMILHNSDINIDSTSAIHLGDAANPAAVDFRDGALVVGPGGYLLGTGVIHGSAAGGNDLVNTGGTIAPGFSPGTLTIDGNFRMESGTLVMEVADVMAGGFDRISADSITILSGTIRIRPSFGFTPGPVFTVDLFDTPNLTIGPGVVVEFDPEFAGSSFDPATGVVTVVSAPEGDGDENGNGIADLLEEVLPPQGAGVEWPTLDHDAGGGSVYSFRRLDSSIGARDLVVQWSENLDDWTDISIPVSTGGGVTVTENGTDPDLIEVVLPDPSGQGKFFARLRVE